jgi:hypothetical protein
VEISDGEEIEVAYNGAIRNYEDPPTFLRERFGFECSCKGCARPAAERAVSERRILAYNNFVHQLSLRLLMLPLGLEDPRDILEEIETQLLIVCEEGFRLEICSRARDAFRLCVFYGDGVNARQWGALWRDWHALFWGPDEDYKEAVAFAARPHTCPEWRQFGRRNMRGPVRCTLYM